MSHYIDGHWHKGCGQTIQSVNPADNTLIWEGFTANFDEVSQAFSAAQKAFKKWAILSVSERMAYLQAFARQVEAIYDPLSKLIAAETGKPLWEANTEVSAVIAKVDISIKAYWERTSAVEIPLIDATGHIRYKPHGVIAVIGPYNFPAHLSNGHIVPALLTGNSIVYKPSELTPKVAEMIMECWHKSGIPSGVINCIQGGKETAKTLLQQDIQGVYFTGSFKTGLAIHQQFADHPDIILALEMGGNNPLVIDHHVDLPAALYLTLLSTLLTSGQRCTCARRIFIPDSEFGDTFLSRFIQLCQRVKIGAYTDKPEPFMGPVIHHQHALAHLQSQKKLQQSGGTALLKMALLKENTGFLSPGVIDMSQVQHPQDDEIFAPLVQVYRYSEFTHALHLANKTRYGLAAGLISNSVEHYNEFYTNIKAGIINWNQPTTGASSSLPFGGIGHSGNHRPSAYFATDYCAYPIASMEQPVLSTPETLLPGVQLTTPKGT